MRLALAAALLVLGLSLALPGVGGRASGPLSAAAGDAPAGPSVAPPFLEAKACKEAQTEFPQSASDFDGLPPGLVAARDDLGLARIVALARSCVIDGAAADAVLVYVRLETPARNCLGGAEHGFLLHPTMIDSSVFLQTLHAWGLPTPTPRPVDLSTTRVANAAETHVTGSPDFIMSVQSSSSTSAAPHALVRIFDMHADGSLAGAFDMVRGAAHGGQGTAHAHFVAGLPQGNFIDVPYHASGFGRTLHPDGFDVAYRPVRLAPADRV